MDARFPYCTEDYVSVPSECKPDCKFSNHVKTDWDTKANKWWEDYKQFCFSLSSPKTTTNMDAKFPCCTEDYVSVSSECKADCKFLHHVKTDWNTKVAKWWEDYKQAKEKKKKRNEIYASEVEKEKAAEKATRIKRRTDAYLASASFQTNPSRTSIDQNDL